MNKEQFIALGLSEDLAEKAATASADELKGFVPKARFDEVNEAKKQAEGSIAERDKQIADLGKTAGLSEEFKKQIETLQGENKAAKEQYEADMKELRLNTALKLSLSGQVHDPDIVAGLLDKTKIELNEDGSVKAGLEDQVKALSESKAFLFVQKEESKPAFKGATPAEAGGGGNPPSDPKGYDAGKSLAEQRNQGGSGK
ncbi:phage scaffolding protein [Paenibacillus xylanexedens]|uniref:phage scaffolding protein n=1 Tax=Paenibacillus xylanexedens TaxID=528191 RepID=UPI0011A91D1D|nr:phage scaffolding protein [Paenibacillus xylanexedens]